MGRSAKKIKIDHQDTAQKRREEKRTKDREMPRKPSFFKVLLEGFETKLDIPPNAVGSFGSEETYVILKTKVGSRVVRFDKTSTRTGGEGGLCLQGRGWVDFVRDNAFSVGDFLVFFFDEGGRDGVCSLMVMPFGQTSCLKPPPKPKATTTTTAKRGPPAAFHKPPPKPNANAKAKRGPPTAVHKPPPKATTTAKRGRPAAAVHKPPPKPKATSTSKSGPSVVHKSVTSHFEVTLTRFNLFALFVPPEFVAETGMLRRTRVAVMDWKGREWSVIVSELSSGGVRIGFGWAEFVKANDLQVGMTCLFQTSYLPDDDDAVAGDDDVFILVANLTHF